MLRDETIETDGDGWANEHGVRDWRVVDRALRALATQYVALDAEQLRWLREAEHVRLWRHLGHVSMIEYLEHVFGYSPRQAEERLRVARKLAVLPELTEALEEGELPFTAVRELSRIATPQTERAWRTSARGKNLRQIEELVAEHEEGDLPGDPRKPELRPRVVRFELRPEVFALLRQTRKALEEERGERLDDSTLIAALCDAACAAGEPDAGRAKFQIAITRCDRCRQARQDGAGTSVAIDDAALSRAECDAQLLGSLDGAGPERAVQGIPPATRRFVVRRDGGRCCVPGCRSSRYVEIHHIVPREHGGTNEPSNLASLCDGHHVAHHRGLLAISGTAPDRLLIERPHVGATGSSNPHVGATESSNPHVGTNEPPIRPTSKSAKFADAQAKTMAQLALKQLGWKPSIAKAAVDEAIDHVGLDVPVEELIREALKRCR